MKLHRIFQVVAAACVVISLGSHAADIVFAPPPAGGFAVTNAAGDTARFRVGEDGAVTVPGIAAVPIPSTGLCVQTATGKMGTCNQGSVSSVVAGTGLTGGTITSSGTIALASGFQLPQSCATGQVPSADGAGGWLCKVATAAGDTGKVLMKITNVTAAAGEEIKALQWGVTATTSWTGGGASVGKPNPGAFSIIKKRDPSTSNFFKSIVQGTAFPQIVFEHYDASNVLIYKMTVTEAFVSNIAWLSADCPSCIDHQISLVAKTFNFLDQATGQGVCWDFALAKIC